MIHPRGWDPFGPSYSLRYVKEYAAEGVTTPMVRRWLLGRGINVPTGGLLPRSAYEGYVKAHPVVTK